MALTIPSFTNFRNSHSKYIRVYIVLGIICRFVQAMRPNFAFDMYLLFSDLPRFWNIDERIAVAYPFIRKHPPPCPLLRNWNILLSMTWFFSFLFYLYFLISSLASMPTKSSNNSKCPLFCILIVFQEIRYGNNRLVTYCCNSCEATID